MATSNIDPVIWQANPACQIHTLTWAESAVIFNEASGQTHFLNDFAHFVLTTINHSDGISRDTLCNEISTMDGIPLDDDLRTSVDQIIATLDELGLIAPRNLPWPT